MEEGFLKNHCSKEWIHHGEGQGWETGPRGAEYSWKTVKTERTNSSRHVWLPPVAKCGTLGHVTKSV